MACANQLPISVESWSNRFDPEQLQTVEPVAAPQGVTVD
jgi:hypothetical protein